MRVYKSKRVPPFTFFGTVRHFPKEIFFLENFKFFSKKNVLRFLSLRYSADLRRSRLVLLKLTYKDFCFDFEFDIEIIRATDSSWLNYLCFQRVVTRCTAVAESGAAGIMLKEAESILNEFGSSRIVLELQFRDEVGSGLGPTLEWYTLISHQLMRKDLEMWRSLDDDESHDYHISADNTIHGKYWPTPLIIKFLHSLMVFSLTKRGFIQDGEIFKAFWFSVYKIFTY